MVEATTQAFKSAGRYISCRIRSDSTGGRGGAAAVGQLSLARCLADAAASHDTVHLSSMRCLPKAAVVAHQCFGLPSALPGQHANCQFAAPSSGMQLSTPSTISCSWNSGSRQKGYHPDVTTQSVWSQAAPLDTAHHAPPRNQRWQPQADAVTAAGPQHIMFKQVLLVRQSPFTLFAAQPSSEAWMQLLDTLIERGDDELTGGRPSSTLLTRKASGGLISRQHAMTRRATIQHPAC